MIVLHECKTDFHHIRIVEDYPIRKMLFGFGQCSEQSGINLEQPHKHVFDYSILAMHSLLFCPDPSSILVVGLGGGFIPMEMAKYTMHSTVDVIEIDPEVKKLAEQYFFFEESDRIKVHFGDAFVVVPTLTKKYDIIVVDAFCTNYIPFHLMTQEFFQSVSNVLSDDGIVAVNLSGVHPSFPSQVKTLWSIFKDNLYCLGGITNRASSMVYASKVEKQARKISGKCCHFLGLIPQKLVLDDCMKSATIFSMPKFKTV